MSEQHEDDPCKELLKRYGKEADHDVSELVTVLAIMALYVICVLLSVAVELTTLIETLPAVSMIGYHKRDTIKAAVPAVKTISRKRKGNPP